MYVIYDDILCMSQLFYTGLFFYAYIESPNPKNSEGPTPQALNPINLKPQPQTPNTRPQPQNPKPPYMSKNKKKI